MKKLLCWALLCLMCLLPVLVMAAPDGSFPWMDTTLRLDWADEEDAGQMNLTVPEGMRLVRLHFSNGGRSIPTEDINANVETFTLRDAAGNDYTADVLQMQGVKFDAETGTFSTDETQKTFDLIFAVPEDAVLTDMMLRTPGEAEGETFVVRLSNVGTKPAEEEETAE